MIGIMCGAIKLYATKRSRLIAMLLNLRKKRTKKRKKMLSYSQDDTKFTTFMTTMLILRTPKMIGKTTRDILAINE